MTNGTNRVVCRHCGYNNMPGRRICWHCQQPLQIVPAQQTPQIPQRPAPQPVAQQPPRAEGVIMRADGNNGQLELLEDRIRIKRKGATALLIFGLKGDKEILITQISSIQFKRVGTFTAGYIQFAFLGGQENQGGLFDAVKDENTVSFTNKQEPAFLAIKQAIEGRMKALRSGAQQPSTPSYADELERLAALKDRGIVTEAEFNAKKRQLLGL